MHFETIGQKANGLWTQRDSCDQNEGVIHYDIKEKLEKASIS